MSPGFILLEPEIILSVVITDVLNHSVKTFLVVRNKSALHIITDEVTQQTTEILMTWIAQERTRVGEHTNKSAQQSKY